VNRNVLCRSRWSRSVAVKSESTKYLSSWGSIQNIRFLELDPMKDLILLTEMMRQLIIYSMTQLLLLIDGQNAQDRVANTLE